MKQDKFHTHGKNKAFQKDEKMDSRDEELIELRQMNNNITILKDIQGLFIKESYIFSNMFTWQSRNIFEIYQGDRLGQQITNKNAIMYAVANISQCCTCDCQHIGTLEIAITTKLDREESDTPFLLLKQKNSCLSCFNSCEIYLNYKGNQKLIGLIQQNYCKSLTLNSNIVNDLTIKQPLCSIEFNQVTYNVFDNDGNKGITILNKQFCDYQNPYSYQVGFPPYYNEEQNTLFMALVIYLGYLNFTNVQKISSRK